MSNHLFTWNRRNFLGTALGGAAYATLGGIPMSVWADTQPSPLAGKTLNLVMRYRTDPERITRILPPGIEPDEAADVMLDWWVRHPTPGTENIYYPDVYSECGVHVTAKYQGRRGMFQVGLPLDQEWGRSMGRENVGLVKKDGVLNIKREGNIVTADLHRRGKLLYRIKTQTLDEPSHPVFWHRETGFGAFLYRYRLNPNWKEGPLDNDPVELWLRVLQGKTGAYPQEPTRAGPRACDAAKTQFDFVDPSVLDPFCEFPLRSIVGISYNETGMVPADEAAYRGKAPRTPTRAERLQLIDSKAFEPWALMNYDRPITSGKAWVPANWPEKTTSIKLTNDELQQYRARTSINLDLTECVDLQYQIDPSIHARTLPPKFNAGAKPIVRILALRVGTNDTSTEGFNELWLMSRYEEAGAEKWYALSNIVGGGGDLVYGRETFGYPSKMGTVEWKRDGKKSSIRGRRMGRDFLHLDITQAGRGAAAKSSIDVVGLRFQPPYRTMTLTGFTEPGTSADLISQPWTFEMTAQSSIDAKRLAVEFPTKPGPGKVGTTDPWFEFKGGKLISAHVGTGVLRRFPASDLGVLPDYRKYYSERYDNADTNETAVSGDVKHTFLVR